jgi:hypothetical protein
VCRSIAPIHYMTKLGFGIVILMAECELRDYQASGNRQLERHTESKGRRTLVRHWDSQGEFEDPTGNKTVPSNARSYTILAPGFASADCIGCLLDTLLLLSVYADVSSDHASDCSSSFCATSPPRAESGLDLT